jgi:hypothetical protein
VNESNEVQLPTPSHVGSSGLSSFGQEDSKQNEV